MADKIKSLKKTVRTFFILAIIFSSLSGLIVFGTFGYALFQDKTQQQIRIGEGIRKARQELKRIPLQALQGERAKRLHNELQQLNKKLQPFRDRENNWGYLYSVAFLISIILTTVFWLLYAIKQDELEKLTST